MLTKKQHELLMFINQRLGRDRRRAVLRRDEGRAQSALEIRHPPPDQRAGGARLYPPAAAPRTGARSGQAAGRERRPGAGRRPANAARTIFADRDPRRFRRGAAGRAGRARQRGGRPAALRPDRRRHADRGVARPEYDGRGAGRPDRARRALRARSRRRQHGRGRHPRRRYRHHPALRDGRERRDRRRAGRQ